MPTASGSSFGTRALHPRLNPYALVVAWEEEERNQCENVHHDEQNHICLQKLVPIVRHRLDDVLQILAPLENIQQQHSVHNGVLNRQQRKRQQHQVVRIFEESERPQNGFGHRADKNLRRVKQKAKGAEQQCEDDIEARADHEQNPNDPPVLQFGVRGVRLEDEDVELGVCFVLEGEKDHHVDQEDEEVGHDGNHPDVDHAEVQGAMSEEGLSQSQHFFGELALFVQVGQLFVVGVPLQVEDQTFFDPLCREVADERFHEKELLNGLALAHFHRTREVFVKFADFLQLRLRPQFGHPGYSYFGKSDRRVSRLDSNSFEKL